MLIILVATIVISLGLSNSVFAQYSYNPPPKATQTPPDSQKSITQENQEQTGTVLTDNKIDLTISPTPPYDHTAHDKVMLTFMSKGSGGKPIQHTDWLIEISMNGKQIFMKNFHDHDGKLELDVTPKAMSEFIVGKPSQDDADKLITSSFSVTGPLFLDNGAYAIKAQITGIEFKPLSTPVTQDFGMSVVPEFPAMVMFPLVLTFSIIIVAARMQSRLQ